MNARELGLTLEEMDPRKAEREFRRSADLYQGAGSPQDAGRALLDLGRLLRGRGELDKALAVLTEGLELTSSTSI